VSWFEYSGVIVGPNNDAKSSLNNTAISAGDIDRSMLFDVPLVLNIGWEIVGKFGLEVTRKGGCWVEPLVCDCI
jgi:hypothetical protein